MSPQAVHVPVMPREVLRFLQLTPGLTVMDGTVGAGGHSSQILSKIGPDGRLFGFDRDPMMLSFAASRLPDSNVQLFHNSYSEASEVLAGEQVDHVDRVLLDLGLSSDQLSDRERGFGFDSGGPLDMRFDTSKGQSAAELLASTDQRKLEEILTDYGEEKFSRQIAEAICQRRRQQTITTTNELEEIVRSAIPRNAGGRSGKNPATRVFQALRIAVNEELEHVKKMMTEILPDLLGSGGIAVIITFHSLEDRIVKSAFKGMNQWQVLTKTPVESTPAEVRINPRSRSAKLRAAKRL